MIQEIEAAIKESLPQKVGEMLRKELEAYEKLKGEYRHLDACLKASFEKTEELETRLKEYEALGLYKIELNERLVDLNKRALNMDLELLQVKLDSANKFNNTMTEFMLNMSRNTSYKKTILGEAGGVIPHHEDQYGNTNPARIDTVPVTTIETIETE